ncbi:MAG: ATP-dependent DNA helicase [Candidatus Paceibacterota bacterium]
MASKIFTEIYKKLNKAQRSAVDNIEGPVMVVAGPGTGKTQILTLRIANILKKTDTAPEQILALTFTDAGVTAMRERLVSIIGVTAYRVPIFTFHGFANEVINRFSEHFPDLAGSRPCSELDRILLMQKVFDIADLEHLASHRAPYHYLQKTLSAISLLKREIISPRELLARLKKEEQVIRKADDYRHIKGPHKGKVKGEYQKREEAIIKNRELALLYKKYEEALADSLFYDYEDMILALVTALETNKNLKLILQEEYQYLLADEYQDGNGAQNRVLDLLADFHDSPNIFIVGDEKQAIYRFQGASHENFTNFKKQYPDAKIITLTENYRSTQNILDIAGADLVAKAKRKESFIKVYECASVPDEADCIAQEISKKIKSGVNPEEIAIFTRTNKELGQYAAALARSGVALSVETKEDILDDPLIEKLLILFNAAAQVGEDFALISALHLDCFNINELEIYELAREARRKKISAWRVRAGGEIERARQLILSWAKVGANVSPAELISNILRESGLLNQFIAHSDADTELDKLARLLTYLEDYTKTHRSARIKDIAKVLSLLDEYNVLESRVGTRRAGRVLVMTAHKAKGLEYEHVYITGVVEGNWGGRASRTVFKIPGIVASTKEEEEADERKLFFVAMTRAKKELTISYATSREDGATLLPSRFIADLPEKLLHKTALCAITQGGLVGRVAQILVPTVTSQTRKDIQDFVRETLSERGLAVTGLNNYLSCPWKYFYRNLLRIPEPQNSSLMFGNAVHATLKKFFDKYRVQEDMGKKELLETLDRELEKEYFTDKELTEIKKNGKDAISGYYDAYKNSWARDIKNEFPIDVMFPVGDGELRLTGKLDKLEITDGAVNVVDYKTGKIKSRNEILGKTKNSEGDYHRQLVFYKLLLDRYEEEKYNMQTGMIDFIIPDLPRRQAGKNIGKYKKEVFTITKEEVSKLEEEVARVANEILNLSFWQKRCGDKQCEYCRLRDIL